MSGVGRYSSWLCRIIVAYPAAIPQCWEALEAATSKRDRPIMATAGPMVSGVIHLSSRLSRPKLIFNNFCTVPNWPIFRPHNSKKSGRTNMRPNFSLVFVERPEKGPHSFNVMFPVFYPCESIENLEFSLISLLAWFHCFKI